MIDGVTVGHPGPLSPRPDIQAHLPGYANTDNAVGGVRASTRRPIRDGLHTIAWVVTDSGGQTDGIGSRYFIIDNQTAALTSQSSLETLVTAQPRVVCRRGQGVFARKGYDEAAAVRARASSRRKAPGRRSRARSDRSAATANSEASGWRS